MSTRCVATRGARVGVEQLSVGFSMFAYVAYCLFYCIVFIIGHLLT